MSSNEQKILLHKIEYAAFSILEQLLVPKVPKKLRLRTSNNEADPVIEFSSRLFEKMVHDLCALYQIHSLIRYGQFSTKRDLYYDNKAIYGTQAKLDRSITNICHLLDCERSVINVLSCSKGVIRGALTLLPQQGSLIDCRKQGVMITEALTQYRVISNADFILVVEKDAAFQKLDDDDFFKIFPNSILVTGKGYPDISTRKFLKWLVSQIAIPVYGLFDGDPHGIEIYLTYKYGSAAEKSEGRGAYVRNMQWIGLKPSEVPTIDIADNHYLPMNNKDYMKITRIRRRAVSLNENELVKELDILRSNRYKFEIEAISSIGHRFLSRFYIFPKVTLKF